MKKTGLKATAATALLSATILGGPLVGSAHGGPGEHGGPNKDKGHSNNGYKSHQIMEKREQQKDERRDGSEQKRGQWNNNVDNVSNVQDKKIDRSNGNAGVAYQDREHVKPNMPEVSGVTFAVADAYGKNTILPLLANINTAEANLDWPVLAENYHLLSKELKYGTAIFYKTAGEENRSTLIANYKAPAEEARGKLALPLSIYTGLVQAEKELDEDNVAKAWKKIEKLKVLASKLDDVENNALQKDIVNKVIALEKKVKNDLPDQTFSKQL